MKLSKLLLQAFGPFTDKVLDFGDGPANLHLIYGPNEAGKSSALRAMTDLRFGIPARSLDDFVHPFGQMRIGGVFIDGQGEAVGLVRRKGRGPTLARLEGEEPAAAQWEAALTGGLGRGEFEAMFGLNHARLREGGNLLLKGEGELGSALFEASAGTRGIAALLAELDADAKKLFNPHGAAKTSVANEARRQFDEQRQALRQAQTKPAEWHGLHKAHEKACLALADVGAALQAERRRENELTEWRTVEPLLREHDRLLAECEALAGAPDLPENAREDRLSAEQAWRRAEDELAEAGRELAQCTASLDGLSIEAVVLDHGEAIERLAAGIEAAAPSRVEIRSQQIQIDALDAAIAAAAAALGRSPEDLARAQPTQAERAELESHLDEVKLLQERLAGERQRAEAVALALGRLAEEEAALPAAAVRQALAQALRHAQSLGDVQRQWAERERQILQLRQQLAQALADLGVASTEALAAARPLLDGEIAGFQHKLEEIEQAVRKHYNEDQNLRRDLQEQQLRRRQLAAVGEVVTADTLRQARERRDALWRRLRDSLPTPPAAPDLAEDFEAAQAEADRQADLLRADAQRAASLEECAARIGQMAQRQADIATELQALAEREQALRGDWAGRLAKAGLPALEALALKEWQGLRQDALALAERLAAAESERHRAGAEAGAAAAALASALQAAGCAGADPASPLAGLVEQAGAWDKSLTEAQAKREERSKARQDYAAEQAELQRRIAGHEAELERHQTRLRGWLGRLLLDEGSPPAAVKARLAELDACARQTTALAEAKLAKARQQAVLDALDAQAQTLAGLLGEPPPAQADVFGDCLRRRLNLSREAEAQRKNLLREQARAEQRRQQAQAELARQAERLAGLCAAAGVTDAAQLPEQEERAGWKRQAHDKLHRLRQQLGQASARPLAELRSSLAGRDSVGLDGEREHCKAEIARLEQEQAAARRVEEQTRRDLESVDGSDAAARAREAMESAAARARAALRPWVRLRLAHALLAEALNRFRERAQAPMVEAASAYFALMTGGRYARLVADEQDGKPVLRAQREDGAGIGVEAMSEGTADQLYLALRLAALALRRDAHPAMPLVLDDVLVTSDDRRAANVLKALARFAEGGQVMLFTHHRHLLDLAEEAVDGPQLALHTL